MCNNINFKYEIGSIVNNIIVIEKYYNKEKRYKMYVCKCLICECEFDKREDKLTNNGCKHCARINHRAKYLYNIGDVVNNLVVLDRFFGKTQSVSTNSKRYGVCCMSCNNKTIVVEYSLKNGHGCKKCTIKSGLSSEFKLNIGDVIGTKKVTSMWYGSTEYDNSNSKRCNYTCDKCGFNGTMSEQNFLKRNCPCCCKTPQVVVEHINSIVANEETHWMVDYFQGGWNEAKLYTPRSNKRVTLMCPYCKDIKHKKTLNNLYRHKYLSCQCLDGLSYPEKFMMNFLKLNNIEYVTQFMFNGFSFRYDFYFKHNGTYHIVETHGMQHYKDCNRTKFVDVVENDMFKYDISILNGYEYNKNYHVIDCRYSDFEHIKQNIEKSLLFNVLGVSEFDWNLCESMSLKNIVKDVCDIKSSDENLTTVDISNMIGGINSNTIASYLKKGARLGWCVYDPKEEMRKNAHRSSYKNGIHRNAREIVLYDEFYKIINVKYCAQAMYDFIVDNNILHCHVGTISRNCREQRPIQGYLFKYTDSLSQQELQQLEEFKIINNITPIS